MKQMTIDDYISFIQPKIKAAVETENREEAIRLLVLLRDTCNETIRNLEKD
jgi:hypothetical protein